MDMTTSTMRRHGWSGFVASLSAFAFVCAIMFAPAWARADPAASDERVVKAASLLDQWEGQTEYLIRAEELLLSALRDYPQSSEVRIQLAVCVMDQGYVSSDTSNEEALFQARQLLTEAGQLAPKDFRVHYWLGIAGLRENNLKEAQESLAALKSLAGGEFAAVELEATILERQAYIEQPNAALDAAATAALNKLLSDPRTTQKYKAWAHEGLAGIHIRSKRYANANVEYLAAIQVAPADAWLAGKYSNLLRVYINDIDGAERWARKALVTKDYPLARKALALALYLKWGQALVERGDQRLAQKYFDEAHGLGIEPEEVLDEIAAYPKPQPVAAALKRIGIGLDYGVGGPGSTTLLTQAVGRGNTAVLAQLLELGVDPNKAGPGGTVPLLVAAIKGDAIAASLLLQHGANPLLSNEDGDDAEYMARERGDLVLAQQLNAAKRSYKPATGRRSRPPDPERPFKPGYVYRLAKTWTPSDGWGSDFKQGEEFRYISAGSATDPAILIFWFQGDEPYKRDWAIARHRISLWSEYFQEIGPASMIPQKK